MPERMLTASELGMAEENGELLLMAAMYDQVDFMNELLMAEVHGTVDSIDKFGLTPLHHAACHGSHRCVELLLQKGADPNACSHTEDNCNTPLHHAARIRDINCITLLVEYGAEIELRNIEGLTAMDILRGNGNANDCIAYLENVIEMRRVRLEEAKREDLYDEVAAGSLERTRELLSSLESIEDAINRYYRGPNTLLYKASLEGFPEIVKLLLENGANGKPNGGPGLTPLYAACYHGHLEVVKILAESLPHLLMKPTVNDQSVPLHAAIFQGKIETIRYLLSLRKEVSIEDPDNRPRRSTGTKRNSRGKEEPSRAPARDSSILDVNFLNMENMSPLHLAVHQNNKLAVLELLNCKPILTGQVSFPHPSCLVIDIAGNTGDTPLLFAIRRKNVEIARLLLENGADANRMDPNGVAMTPLQEACQMVCQDMIELLLVFGSNPNLFPLGRPENSPLAIASRNNALPAVKLLLDSGAKDVNDVACLQAIRSSYHHIVGVFLDSGVFSETESKPEEVETTYAAVRIIWSNRQLPEVVEKWFIDAVVRLNMAIGLERNIRMDEMLDRSTACSLITQLDLSGNNLTSVPLLLFQLPSLRRLSLADNKLTALPVGKKPKQEQSGKTGDPKQSRNPDDIPEHSEDPERQEQGSEKSKASNDAVNVESNRNNGVKLRPVRENLREGKSVSEQYQTSSSQNRPISNFVPTGQQQSFPDSKQSDNSKPDENVPNENQTGTFDNPSWDCPQLEELEVQKNQLESVPKCLFELPSLRILNLLRNNIRTLPFEFWSAPSLKDVYLQENKLTCLPSNPLRKMKKQHRFSRPNSRVGADSTDGRRHDGPRIGSCDTLRSRRPSWDGDSDDESDDEEDAKEKLGILKLDVSDNKDLKELPNHLPCLAPNLSKLTAAGCSIEGQINLSELPSELIMLDLSRNKISLFNLTGNEPKSDRSCFSPAVAKLKKSSSVPSNINRPRQARKLCHHRSHERFLRLKNINLSDNSLKSFLFMKHNSKNDLIDCALPELRTLTLSKNELTEVPAHIGKVRSLLSLDVSGNPSIYSLPSELGLCSQMYELKFNPAQIRDPNRTIVEKKNQKGQIDVPYIRNFLKGVYEQSKPYLTIKLMLVGHSGKGKSTLLENLRKEGTGAYQDQGSQRRSSKGLSTVGVDVCDWTYHRRQFIGPSTQPDIRFITWDFAGQEEYYATHTCFLSKRAIYLLVWKLTDGTKGIDQLAGWLHNIQARAPDSPVIVVGTHYDELPSAGRQELITKYRKLIFTRFVSDKHGGGLLNISQHGIPRVVDVVEISSKPKSEHNIRELRGLIYDNVLSVQDFGDGFPLQTEVPASYIELEKAVLAKAKSLQEAKQYPVLNAVDFRTEMQRAMQANGFRELQDDELENAVKFLHDCGILLHFDGAALEDLYFIDPQWLCDMLARVVTIRDVNPFIRNGVLKVDELRTQIFKSRRFSSNHIKKYIELMNKFEVALQISSHFLLVPSLLPLNQRTPPRISDDLPGTLQECMGMRAYFKETIFRRLYHMAYVPSGFWARLISRLIADVRIAKVVASCSEFANVASEVTERIDNLRENLRRVAPPEWDCWRTGIELSCFGVKLLRVCELSPGELFFGHHGDSDSKIHTSGTNICYSNSHIRFIEILVPNVRLQIAVDFDDVIEGKTSFRVIDVIQNQRQKACELLVLVTEHFDNLMVDWFPALDSQNIQGQKAVHKLGLCPECVVDVIRTQDEVSSTRQNRMSEGASASTTGVDSASNCNNNIDEKMCGRREKGAKSCSKSMYEGGNKGKRGKRVETERGKSMYAGSKEDSKTHFSNQKKGSAMPGKKEHADKNGDVGDNEGGTSKATEKGYFSEHRRPSDATAEEQRDDQQRENSRNGGEDIEEGVIWGFLFKEAMEKIDADEAITCNRHGVVEFSKVFPDLVFIDLPEGFVYEPDEIETKKFIAAGSYGAVFRAVVMRNNQEVEVAVKVPNNTDAGNTKDLKAKQDAQKNKKLKEGAITIFLSGIYSSIRQELAILVPLKHPNIIDLLGIGLSPLRLLVEFAPERSLDRILRSYKNAGRKLDPYTIQESIIQVSSALVYLHEHGVIYRDLKSENILAWSFPAPGHPSGTPVKLKLTDYGVSCTLSIGGVKGHSGTSGFIAPEILRFRGRESYSRKVDSFSFGSFIYELITQELPFEKYGSGQADQFLMDKQRPKLLSGAKRMPIPILSLLYKCWEHDPSDRPSSTEIHAFARLPEFPRLFDDLECDEHFDLKCALTAFKERPAMLANCADTKSAIGSKLWLFSNCTTQRASSSKSGEISVVNYTDGKCSSKKVAHLPNSVISACVVGSSIWIGMETGELKVYCSMTYKPLGMGRAFGSGSIISILHSPACHCVIIGMTNDCILSYNENLSAYIHTISKDEAAKHFGDIKHEIKELIANKVHPGSSMYNPIHCMAAVPSRVRSEPKEEQMTYYGSDGNPVARSSRDNKYAFDEYMKERTRAENVITYELWCGFDKGIINIFDAKELQLIHTMAASGCDVGSPVLKSACVKCIETRRTFQTSGTSSNVPKMDQNDSHSVWVVIYLSTLVYRWNVDERKIEAKFDTLTCSIDRDLSSTKPASYNLLARDAQVNVIAVVEDELYIGTNFGVMIICDSMSLTPISSIRCFSERIGCIIPLQMSFTNRGLSGSHRDRLVLCSGKGCLDRWNRGKRKRPADKKNITLLTWFVDRWRT